MTSLSRYARNYGQHGLGWQRMAAAAKKRRAPKKPSLYPTLPSLEDSTVPYSPLYPSLPDDDDSQVLEESVEDSVEGEVVEEVIEAIMISKEEMTVS